MEETRQKLNWKRIILHVLIIWILTFYAGFLIGFAVTVTGGNAQSEGYMLAIGLSNLSVIFFAALIISIFERPTWKHLSVMTLILTIKSLVNTFDGQFTFEKILIGGGISLVLVFVAKLLSIFVNRVVAKFILESNVQKN